MRALVAAVLLVAGCTTQTGFPVRPVPEGAKPGGVLRVGITAPGSVDPGNDYEPAGDLVIRTMCDPLIAVDPVTGDLRPALVRSWVVSDNGQRLVLRLRKGLRFSDGSPLTADDVVFSLSRIASADFASAAANQLESIGGYPEVHGDKETQDDAKRRQLSGVKALDQQSVEITLSDRKADFLRLLTSRLTTPVSRAEATRSPVAFGRRPVCSGPYALTTDFHTGDTVIRLRRVPYASDSTLTQGGAGYADGIAFHIYPSTALAAAAQRRGEVDIAAAEPADRTHLQTGPGPLVDFVGFPTATGPVFDKPVVRRALALALDRQALVDQVFPATRTVATGFLPPTDVPVFHPRACSDLPARGSVREAQRLLRQAGLDLKNVTVRFSVNADGRNVALATAVARQWRAATGLNAVVTPTDFDSFIARGTSPKGLTGPFRFSWATTFPDPDGSLYPLFSTERVGRDNFSRFSDSAVDRALTRQAREAENSADRSLEYRRVEGLLCQQLPMVPLTFSLSRYLVSPGIATAAGTFLDHTSGLPLLRELYLTAARRP